jgi:siroheme synthase-like protein
LTRGYPIVLDLADRPCLVVGGGAVAEPRVEGLLTAGARVTVVSPEVTPRLASWIEARWGVHVAREYRAGDLVGMTLAFAATDDGAVNAAVAAEGRERGVWVNAADDAAHCDLFLPAVVRRGPLVIAVSTGGSSPALARAIRKELDAYFSEDYAVLAELVAEVRRDVRRRGARPSAAAWSRGLSPRLRGLIAEGRHEDARRYLFQQLGSLV